MSTGQYPHYALPWRTIAQLLLSAAVVPDTRPHRSFREDAQACVAHLRPALRIRGQEHIPSPLCHQTRGTQQRAPFPDYLNHTMPGLGYLVIFGGYGILFLLSVVSLKGITED